MLYYLFFYLLRPHFSPLNVFRYITVRTAMASSSALLLSLLLGPWVIERLRDLQVKQYIREEGPKGHQKKAGTPTMGGVLIVAAIVIPTFLWADLRNAYVLLAMGATLAFGTIGFVDDYNKVVRRRNLGLTPRAKFSLQVLTCVLVGIVLVALQTQGEYSMQLSVPFFKRLHPSLVISSLFDHTYIWPLAYVPFVLFLVLVIVGCSNAVNLTDGLDGLAIGCVLVSSTALTVLTCVLVGIVLVALQTQGEYSMQLSVPFFKRLHPSLVISSLFDHAYFWPLAYVPFVLFLVLVIVGCSNAVNLTDGLDGLAIGCVLVSSTALTVLTYLSSNAKFADYLDLQKIPDAGELVIFCGSLAGASLGFLWYNAHPAEMFMGDVGSLALGGAIGTVAVIIKQEILLLSIGGVFVLEALSVIIQVGSFKLTGKRVFRMAPLHHHFELLGWSESKIIVRFWIVALVFALFSLTTLKLR